VSLFRLPTKLFGALVLTRHSRAFQLTLRFRSLPIYSQSPALALPIEEESLAFFSESERGSVNLRDT
jgi:hypothetical protein